MPNTGKIFEGEIKDSIPSDTLYYRIKDPAQGFSGGSTTRFSLHNECDAFLFKSPNLIALELKSTQNTSIPFSTEDNKKSIKRCQIEGLSEYSIYKDVIAGFLFNFRKTEKTYFLPIDNFLRFIIDTNKSSINEKDILEYGGTVIPQKKKITRYIYDISSIFKLVI